MKVLVWAQRADRTADRPVPRRRNGEVDAHQPGQEHSDKRGEERQSVILLADHFMVETEDVLPNKACRRRVVVYSGR